MHYYKKNIGDYFKKAGRLSMLQHGAYTLLIDTCYDREQFPTRDQAIEWTWASSPEEICAVDFVLHKFFVVRDSIFVQTRIEEELEKYHEISSINKQIAIERETNRKSNITKRVNSVNEAPPNHKPLTNNHIKEVKEKTASASRLPIDWEPDCNEIEFCKSTRPDLDIQSIADSFRDYWISIPGTKGKKLDWNATWRNWIRNSRQSTFKKQENFMEGVI